MRLDREKPPQELQLFPAAKKLWPYFVDEVYERGYGERVPPHRLGIYVQIFSQYQRCTAAIEKAGQIQVHTYPPDKDTGEQSRKREEISADALQQAKLVAILKSFDKELGFLEERTVDAMLACIDSRMAQGAVKKR